MGKPSTKMEKNSTESVSEKLFAALVKIDRPGAFCTFGSAATVLPGLEVDKLGPIGLPLTVKQAKELKRHCEQAPYGKGEETLVDTKIRRVWRLTPEHFSLTNPAWKTVLNDTVAKVQAELGLDRQKLEAHLYDLLLYEKGSFFLPHRDGEKLDRMVATLIIILPSLYEGGELVVRHEGQEQTIDLSGDSRFHAQFVAFYADCEHEVRPLRSGYRLCLVYNLTLAKSKKALGAPRSLEHITNVESILRDWSNDPHGPRKLAVTMEHQYTQDGLAWDALKGIDRVKARVLAEAARRAGCQAHLALVTLWESGSAEGFEYSPRNWRGRHRHEEGAVEHEMGEIFDTSLTAEHWSSPTGDRPGFGTIPVEREEVVPQESLTAVKPEEDFEGYTGNEGMTLERWYRHAAVVLWPDERHFDVLCEAGSRQAVPALARMVSTWRRAKGEEAATQQARCLEFAGRILAQWEANPFRGRPSTEEDADAADAMAPLARLDDAELIRTYLRVVLVKDASLEPGKATVKTIVRHGWATFRPELETLFQATDGETIERNVRLLERMCLASARGDGKKSDEVNARETCRLLAEAAVAALEAIDARKEPGDWRMSRIERSTLLARLARALLAADLDDLLSRVVAQVLESPKRYPLRTVHVPALAKLGPWLKDNLKSYRPALSHWGAACREQLESLTAAPPQPPRDFGRGANVTCDCQDCAELKRFLHDSQQREHSFQMPQQRRDHLESNIRTYHCDLDCRTDKRPRPQILICTKNTASHERRLKEYQEDLERLATLQSLETSLSFW